MGPLEKHALAAAAIANAAYLVRSYSRPVQRTQRRQALQHMGAVALEALRAAADDYEPILYAIADGLYPFEADRHDGRRRR